ncbi:hypothetical protein J6590_089468 [Homalodisca vitripennis]|nr:hypothetical protein J6590_089468 [Homalodisca vitripennis]
MENKSIEAWLAETEDIPSDPESEDDEDIPGYNHSAEGVEPGIPEGNAVLDVQNQPMDVQFDEDSEPLANRLYKDSVTWYQKYYSPNKSYDFNERTGPLIDASTPV